MISIDIMSLFIVLLVTALLQEFIIKPSVGFIKHHMRLNGKRFGLILYGEKKKC